MSPKWFSALALLPVLAFAADADKKPSPATNPSAPAAVKKAATTAATLDENSIPRESDPSRLGLNLPRTMALLQASQQGSTQPLRVLFYGQSIVAQGRLQSTLINELRRQYPKAIILPVSNAIGGYTAPQLLRPLVHDVVSVKPDLIVFDDYEGEKDGAYEQIIAYLRSQTTAEILLWSPHLDNFNAAIEKQREQTAIFRRDIAAKYGCEFADVRGVWSRYLEQNHLPRTALLQDVIHNNNTGCELMARILLRHFVVNPSARPNTSVQTILLQEESKWTRAGVQISGSWKPSEDQQGIELTAADSKLELQFTGNRVDLIGAPQAQVTSARILIDGQAPSAVPALWVASRPSAAPIGWFPALNRVTLGSNLPVRENWTLHCFNVAKNGTSFKYRLTGSVTGPDGEGDSSANFISQSKRIEFLASDFTLATTARVMKKEFPAEFDITFRTFPLGIDDYHRKPEDAKYNADYQTLVNGLSNQPHRLTIIFTGPGPLPLRGLIIHQPQYTPFTPTTKPSKP